MVRLVPIENDVIPMVLLVNMHFIKGTSIIFSQVTWENNLSPLKWDAYSSIELLEWHPFLLVPILPLVPMDHQFDESYPFVYIGHVWRQFGVQGGTYPPKKYPSAPPPPPGDGLYCCNTRTPMVCSLQRQPPLNAPSLPLGLFANGGKLRQTALLTD